MNEEKKTPILPETLKAAGWQYYNGIGGGLKHWFSPENREDERRIEIYPKGDKMIVLLKDSFLVGLPPKKEKYTAPIRNCTTMEQLESLSLMFLGKKIESKEGRYKKRIEELLTLLDSALESEKEWRDSWKENVKKVQELEKKVEAYREELARLKLYLTEEEVEEFEGRRN